MLELGKMTLEYFICAPKVDTNVRYLTCKARSTPILAKSKIEQERQSCSVAPLFGHLEMKSQVKARQ